MGWVRSWRSTSAPMIISAIITPSIFTSIRGRTKCRYCHLPGDSFAHRQTPASVHTAFSHAVKIVSPAVAHLGVLSHPRRLSRKLLQLFPRGAITAGRGLGLASVMRTASAAEPCTSTISCFRGNVISPIPTIFTVNSVRGCTGTHRLCVGRSFSRQGVKGLR